MIDLIEGICTRWDPDAKKIVMENEGAAYPVVGFIIRQLGKRHRSKD